jgi:hypothetical protein
VNWIHLTRDRDQWRPPVNTVINFKEYCFTCKEDEDFHCISEYGNHSEAFFTFDFTFINGVNIN